MEDSHIRAQLLELLERNEGEIIERWMDTQRREQADTVPMVDEELRFEAADLTAIVRQALDADLPLDRIISDFEPLRSGVTDLAARWAKRGFPSTAMVLAVQAIKYACVEILREDPAAEARMDPVLALNRLADGAALLAVETYVQGREEIIRRQSEELLELATPVVYLWERVLALPLIGTLDSARAQVVMESLLQRIQDVQARVAIIDITGVATMDTMVAQHLIQTAAATRLMGARCILSGIRPETAQTIARLGIDLGDTLTRATLADALATAIDLVKLDERRNSDRGRKPTETAGGRGDHGQEAP